MNLGMNQCECCGSWVPYTYFVSNETLGTDRWMGWTEGGLMLCASCELEVFEANEERHGVA